MLKIQKIDLNKHYKNKQEDLKKYFTTKKQQLWKK